MAGGRALLALAACAALVASLGDFLMLWVANAARPELALAAPPAFALPAGGVLGVAAIPMYGLGYVAVARALRPDFPVAAGIVCVCGVAGALVGAAIHGVTWRAIHAGLATGAAAAPPLESVAASPGLSVLWAVAGVLVLSASVALTFPATLPRSVARLNPVIVTTATLVIAMPSEWGRAFLAPAAPNLAHVAFFLAAWRSTDE